MKLKNVELKPCPICGGKAELKQKKKAGHVRLGATCEVSRMRYIRCSICHAKTEAQKNIDDAILMWNLREIYRVH